MSTQNSALRWLTHDRASLSEMKFLSVDHGAHPLQGYIPPAKLEELGIQQCCFRKTVACVQDRGEGFRTCRVQARYRKAAGYYPRATGSCVTCHFRRPHTPQQRLELVLAMFATNRNETPTSLAEARHELVRDPGEMHAWYEVFHEHEARRSLLRHRAAWASAMNSTAHVFHILICFFVYVTFCCLYISHESCT
jgi:hypothetical protein